MLGRGLLTLLNDGRALWQRLRADPELIPAAVEELLRYNPLARTASLRIATEDVELPSGTVRAGEPALVSIHSATHDPKAYPAPDTPRLDREGSATQLAFGAGPHFCLGAHVVRATFQIALEQIIQRFPTLRLDVDPATLGYSEGDKVSALLSLPLSW
jgi:cytochrome P450